MSKAMESKDYAAVVASADKIINGVDKAAAGDLVSAGTMLNTVVTFKQQAGELDAQEAVELFNKAITALTAAKSKSDYDATVALYKESGVDVEAIAAALPEAAASFQASLEAAEEEGEAEEGEYEGEEGEEE